MTGDSPSPAAPVEPPPPPPPPNASAPASSYSWVDGAPPRQRRNTQIAIAVVVAGVIVGVGIALPLTLLGHSNGTGSGTSGGSSTEASSVYRDAMSKMRAAAGFHYVAVLNGATGQRTVGDATRDGGQQEITVTSQFGTEHFTLLLTGGTVYFQGNVPAFEDELGVAPSKAQGLQNTWIAVSKQDGPYSTLAIGITTADQADETALQPSSSSAVTSNGVSMLRLQGAVPPQQGAPGGTGHLDVTAKGHQALSYYQSLSQSGTTLTSTVTFSAWGTVATITAPPGTTAWSTLGGTPPPGGYGNGGFGPASPTPSGTI
ncbi:MAG: hypothetical protein ACREN2_10355 [Candidatus Dormibacteria bacterium]